MRIRTLWKIWDDDGLELLFALDDNTVAENHEAWEAGRESARVRYRITDADMREVTITVPYEEVLALFEPPAIVGTVHPGTVA